MDSSQTQCMASIFRIENSHATTESQKHCANLLAHIQRCCGEVSLPSAKKNISSATALLPSLNTWMGVSSCDVKQAEFAAEEKDELFLPEAAECRHVGAPQDLPSMTSAPTVQRIQNATIFCNNNAVIK